jgi:hypothetical protein
LSEGSENSGRLGAAALVDAEGERRLHLDAEDFARDEALVALVDGLLGAVLDGDHAGGVEHPPALGTGNRLGRHDRTSEW